MKQEQVIVSDGPDTFEIKFRISREAAEKVTSEMAPMEQLSMMIRRSILSALTGTCQIIKTGAVCGRCAKRKEEGETGWTYVASQPHCPQCFQEL